MARDLVKRNVVELTEVPTGRAGRRSKSLTPKQVDEVLTKTATDRLHTYIVVSLLTGGRTEELRGAELGACAPRGGWVVAAARGGVAVRTSRWRHQNQEVPADVALPEQCIEALCRQRAQQAANRLSAGERWRETGLVFTTSVGTKMLASNVRRGFRSALALIPGLNPSEWTPRELRHSFGLAAF